MDIFLDTETTGSRRQDAVIEIGAVTGRGRVLIDTLVSPLAPVTRGARRVHGITEEELRDAPAFPAVADRLKALLAEADAIWAFSATYDRRMLLQTAVLADCFQIHQQLRRRTWRDLQPKATSFLGDKEQVSLTNAAERLDVLTPEEGHHHRALYDARLARRIWTSVCSPTSS
ncbi:MAG: exonuclease domain-containing protein [Salinibacter sp.]|uniref:3'-5' exonuclease n=1 Tax=Salinibacter sp. TaxID=2065818 RepID=UPI0035D4EE20